MYKVNIFAKLGWKFRKTQLPIYIHVPTALPKDVTIFMPWHPTKITSASTEAEFAKGVGANHVEVRGSTPNVTAF